MEHDFSAGELFNIEKAIATLTEDGKRNFFEGNKDQLTFRSFWDNLRYHDMLYHALKQDVHKNKSLRTNCGV